MKHSEHLMKRKMRVLALLFFIVFALTLCACAESGDRVERFAEANYGSGENIAIPGYETLSFRAKSTAQTVSLKNPAENACIFILSLVLEEGGETLWTGDALSPGEEYTRITLNRALEAGEYAATLHYDCYTIEDHQPLNGAEIQLTIKVR